MAPETQEYDFSGTVDYRIERLIFYATRHGNTLSQLKTSLDDANRKIQDLEKDKADRDVEAAVATERNKAVLERLTAMEKSIDGLKGVLNKAIVVILTAMGLAIMNWIFSGGLRITGAALRATGVAP